MRKVGIPVTIRVAESTLAIASKQAIKKKKKLRGYLREIIESHFQTKK